MEYPTLFKVVFIPKLCVKIFSTFHWLCWSLFPKKYCVTCKISTLKVLINFGFVTSFKGCHYILLFRYIYCAQLILWFFYSKRLHVNCCSYQWSKWSFATSLSSKCYSANVPLDFCTTADFEIKYFFQQRHCRRFGQFLTDFLYFFNPSNFVWGRYRFIRATTVPRATWGVENVQLRGDFATMLGRLRLNSLCVLGTISFDHRKSHGWSASVYTRIIYLRNGWTDPGKTWCAVGDPLNMNISQVRRTSARSHVDVPILYLRNECIDYLHLWCVIGDLLDMSFTQLAK